jgi:UDP-N-acetylmuramoyl-L-alanyl-D-glutamate--2,6-diaminopimelate ligase
MIKKLKKIYWFIDAYISSKRFPINNSLVYLGVTGTDGKTTTASYMYEMALAHGYKPVLISTVGAKFNGEDIPLKIKSSSFFAYSIKTFFKKIQEKNLKDALKALFLLDKQGYESGIEQHRTTPLSSEIRKTILEYEKKGANLFVLEVTSHALDQFRVYGIKFDSVTFTNITNEHLDYHGTWENYALTKAKLMNHVKNGGSISINIDDRSYEILNSYYKSNNFKQKNIILNTYSIKKIKNISPSSFYINIENNHFEINRKLSEKSLITSINLIGKYNLYNALAAFSCFYGFNNSNVKLLARSIQNLKSIKGRMEKVNDEPLIIVDFAHTPNGMKSALTGIRKKNTGRIWVIFGCAGNRDKYKRPEMGSIAYDLADNILITAEDPRTENLFAINNEIISGFNKFHEEEFIIENYYPTLKYDDTRKKFIVRFDEPNPNSRKNAINYAIQNAKSKDIILILGKGHEPSICFGETEYPWNDIEITKSFLKS